nr:glycerate kinase [Bacillota bacterium]
GAHVIHKIASIDLSTIDPRLRQVPIDVACNWHNILCGPHGVTRVFGRQKGATEKQLLQLERSFEHLASLIEKKTGRAVDQMPGGGASGGLGAGLHGLFGARLHPRYDIIMKQLDLDRYLRETDLVITAEGSIDFQTPRGKIPAEVATRAKRYGKPVIAIAGMIGEGARLNYRHGIDVYTSILQSPVSLEQAMEKTEAWLEDCAESLMRTLWIGQELAATQYQRQVASGQ